MEFQWINCGNVSVFHAAWCICHFPEQTQQCSNGLCKAARELEELCGKFGVFRPRFWDQILTLAATASDTGNLAEQVAARLGVSSPTRQAQLAAGLNRCRGEFEGAFPRFELEIPLRTGPLRQLWEATGPGLMRMVSRNTVAHLLVASAQIIVVQPVLGGLGYAHLTTNRVHIEGVLTNVSPELPETLRLAWLLAQLDFERPVQSGNIDTHRLHSIAGLAMLPIVLAAGEALDVCHSSVPSIQRAIELWRADTLGLEPVQVASVLSNWWETYQVARPAWKVALTGLDKMLS